MTKARITIFEDRCPVVGVTKSGGTGLRNVGFAYWVKSQKSIPSPWEKRLLAVDNMGLTPAHSQWRLGVSSEKKFVNLLLWKPKLKFVVKAPQAIALNVRFNRPYLINNYLSKIKKS